MVVHSINDISNKEIIKFLKSNLKVIDDPIMVQNYHPDFENKPGNLFYVLKEGRYKNGNYYILEDNGKYCASAGWNPYTYRNQKIALGLTRCYISKEYRSKWLLSKYFLPKILQETISYKKIWFTMNQYNRTIYKGFELLSKGKNAGLGEHWPKIFNMFIPIGIKTVYSTKQYVVEFNRLKKYIP